MSSRISPDGMYYWDGAAWKPVAGAQRGQAGGRPLQPTSWTRPLQLAVVALYGAQALFAASVPFWFIATMTEWADAMNERYGANPSPPADAQSMNDAATVGLYLIVVIGIVIAVAAIIAALRRWTWAHYAIAVLLGLQAMFALGGLLEMVLPSLVVGGPVPLPVPVVVPELSVILVGGALLIWMILAAATRGPWGMRPIS